ncbi:MAG TPA: 2,3-bisphosphoglycerate-independent phosphoglycerate mutase [Candidatus Portnoybacteria bacterium]|nr:2,3-bisphosphoglycerate-independent phosphoglycerate mutase [Candidatus Portnoybacteria bacterium]
MKKRRPVVLIILDGWGIAPPSKGNAISLADTPNMDKFWQRFPKTTLKAFGRAVGLAKNQTSGSEAGHLNIGAGRIVKQDSLYISESISQGSFFRNPVLKKAFERVKENNSKMHLMGLLSSRDSPHSDPDHLEALLVMAKQKGLKKVFIHIFTDGRDAPPRSALKYLSNLQSVIKTIGLGEIATVSGRYYAMDRTKNWDRLDKAYQVIAKGKGKKANSPQEAIEQAYDEGLTDEFVLPTVIIKNKKPIATVNDKDNLILFNLRSDRTRYFTELFVSDKVDGQKRKWPKLKNLFFVALTDFGFDLPIEAAFPSYKTDCGCAEKTLPWVLGDLKQLYIAETEKYAHVTYFFNGGHFKPIGGEKRIIIKSPPVASYDQKPEMSAFKITEVVAKSIRNNLYDFITINFANVDMLGHTGNMAAAIKAVETVDKCLGKIVKGVLVKDGAVFITADHGNADEMIDLKNGQPLTMHTKNPVPFIMIDSTVKKLRSNGLLGDVAPTILEIMDRKKPEEMTGHSLII